MTNREPTATTNLDKTSETEPLPWKRARDLFDAGALAEAASFLGTGPPPWQVYRVAAHTVFGVATAEPYGATRWQI